VIRVPVRLVSVPALVTGADNRVIGGLRAQDFRVYDRDRPQDFKLDTAAAPVSVVIAAQASHDVRSYLPALGRVGSAIESLLVGETGECAVLAYGDEVELAKPFGSGDLAGTLRALPGGGFHARAIDAGVRALAMLRRRPSSRGHVLLYIGQPADHGSDYTLDALREDAWRDNVTVHALVLPLAGASFVSDTFSLKGLSSSNILERGGFKAGVDLTRLLPLLARSAAAAEGADPFSALAGVTGGTQFHVRGQQQMEDAVSVLGVALRSVYTLSFTPPPGEPGYHELRVETSAPGAKVHARPGYRMTAE